MECKQTQDMQIIHYGLFFLEIFDFDYLVKMVVVLAPKPIDMFSYLFKSHCCLDQSKINRLSISGRIFQDK
jgi:hypothetical protein